MIRVFTLLTVMGGVLFGCANETTGNHYYQLAGHQQKSNQQGSKKEDISSQSLILLEPIQLADFLRQPGIVIQKSEHQLQLSSIHRWADSLENATMRVFQASLEEQLAGYRIERQGSKWNTTPKIRIKLSLEQFQIDNRLSQTITAGQYWVFDENRMLVSKKHFSIVQPMDKSGYENAVSQLEISLQRLAALVANDIKVK